MSGRCDRIRTERGSNAQCCRQKGRSAHENAPPITEIRGRCRLLGRLTRRVEDSVLDGGTAAAGRGDCGVGGRYSKLDAALDFGPQQRRDVEGMTEGRGTDLRES